MAKLSAEELKNLPDSMFGLPKERKYPLTDEEHVRKAIQFFRYCPNKDKKELAKNINRRAKQLKMKIKVQPSSPFYKYADQSILKEAMLIKEFHIGQLSPIVPIKPEVIHINFANGKSIGEIKDTDQIRKLGWIWDKEDTSTEEKNEATLNLAAECAKRNYKFTKAMYENFNAIVECNYMTRSGNDFDMISSPIFEDFVNSAGRTINNDYVNYDLLLKSIKDEVDTDNIIKIVSQIRNKDVLAAAIAFVNSSTNIRQDDKKIFNSKIDEFINPKEISIVMTKPEPALLQEGIPPKWNFTPDDDFIVKNFVENVKDDRSIMQTFERLARIIYPDIDSLPIWGVAIPSMMDLFIISKYCENHKVAETNLGYSEVSYREQKFLFLKKDTVFYLVKTVMKNSKEKFVFCMKIYDVNIADYNTGIIDYCNHIFNANFYPVHNKIDVISGHAPKLEAQDFKDVVAGFNISSCGNLSMVYDESKSWVDKLAVIKMSFNNAEANEDWESYKYNLGFLFATIGYISKVYIEDRKTLKDGGYEYKDAMSAYSMCVMAFKSKIRNFWKIQDDFDFVDWYVNKANYNEKLRIFDIDNDKESLTSKVRILYDMIIR